MLCPPSIRPPPVWRGAHFALRLLALALAVRLSAIAAVTKGVRILNVPAGAAVDTLKRAAQ